MQVIPLLELPSSLGKERFETLGILHSQDLEKAILRTLENRFFSPQTTFELMSTGWLACHASHSGYATNSLKHLAVSITM